MKVTFACALALGQLLACSADPTTRSSVETLPDGAKSDPGADVGTTTIITGDGAAVDSSPATFDKCASDRRTTDPREVDIYVMLDQSGSMTLEGNRWGPVTTALKAFVDDPASAGLGMGLQYFPRGTDDAAKCDVAGYAVPAVPIAPLSPVHAAAIKLSIEAHAFTTTEARNPEHAGTPTRPALEGATRYVQSWLQDRPKHTGVVLLATDGQPSTGLCTANRIADIMTVAQAAASLVPAIATYVIGIGDTGNLNDIALAGSWHAAFIVDGTGQTTQQEFLAAMNAIRASVLPCDYAIPPTEAGSLDPALVNVAYTQGGSKDQVVIPKATGGIPCPGEGWVYDDEAHPTKVILCDSTCSTLQHDRMAAIEIVFGCRTIIVR